MTDLFEKLQAAKARLNAAAAACLAGTPGATEQADAACLEVNRLLAEQQNQKPPPAGSWVIAAELRAEREAA